MKYTGGAANVWQVSEVENVRGGGSEMRGVRRQALRGEGAVSEKAARRRRQAREKAAGGSMAEK